MQGALVIDKQAGWTSHDVVARVRKIIGVRKVGHTGTLDPFATGVLVLLIGPATRLGQFLSDAEKEYEAVIRLGYATDTGDATGSRLESGLPVTHENPFREEEIENAMASLRGEIEQTPPMYSAKKIAGKKLYEFARRGETVERKPQLVRINEFEAIPQNGVLLKEDPEGTEDLRVRVVCSAGTYIRTLAEDFGKRLNIGAHVSELHRTRAGRFKIDQAIPVERLEELVQSGSLAQVLVSPDEMLSHLPAVLLSDEDVIRTRNGIDLSIEGAAHPGWENDQLVRLRDETGNLIAVAKYSESQRIIHPSVVISTE